MLTDDGVYIKFDLETIVRQLKNISLFFLEDAVNCYFGDVTLIYTFSGLSVGEFSSKHRYLSDLTAKRGLDLAGLFKKAFTSCQ